MMIDILNELYKRDLGKLRDEIAAYENEDAIWKTGGAITNSAGNLCLHLVGNLNAFIAAELGGSGYARDRDLEFSDKDVPRSELLKKVDDTILAVATALEKVNPDDLEKEYPKVVLTGPMTTGQFLTYLTTHLSYHLGQINYHRRFFDGLD
ncbi:MAG: DinB family protein [Acidobacteriota bacterium]